MAQPLSTGVEILGPEARAALAARFWSKVDVRGDADCWLWTAAKDKFGYGRFMCLGRNAKAQRVSYELTHGPIPAGMVTDHKCRNRQCVNPRHLEPVSNVENIKRGDGLRASSIKFDGSETCPQGHPRTLQNTHYARRRGKDGAVIWRSCLVCRRERNRAYLAARRASA